jgi:flagellar hook assembly protein FlgD
MATPNPFVWNGMASQKTIIRNVPADADVHIYSADGMLVRTIPISERGPSATAEWDGRNDSGKPVATGIYIMIAPSKSGVAKGKVAFVRE